MPWKGGPNILYLFNVLEINPLDFGKYQQNSHPNIPKCSSRTPSVPHIPLSFCKNAPYPINYFANIPISLNTLQGPHKQTKKSIFSHFFLNQVLNHKNLPIGPWCSKETKLSVQLEVPDDYVFDRQHPGYEFTVAIYNKCGDDKSMTYEEAIKHLKGKFLFNKILSRLVGKPTMWFLNRSDTNRAVQLQKQARSLKFWS